MTSNGLRVVAKKTFLQQKKLSWKLLEKSVIIMRIFNCVKTSASADVHALDSLSPLERYGGSIDTLFQWTAVTTVTSSLCGDWTAWIEHLGDITWYLLTSDKYTRILAATDVSLNFVGNLHSDMYLNNSGCCAWNWEHNMHTYIAVCILTDELFIGT